MRSNNGVKPRLGELKCNVDVATFIQQGGYMFDMCIKMMKEIL